MKNLANCKPSEFLVQTNKIRKAVEKWLKITDIMSIRKQKPLFTQVTSDMSPETIATVTEENRKLAMEQARKNISDMFDAVLEKHPQETLELLALMCFIEPEEADEHTVQEYLLAFAELLGNEAVISFFGSLMRLGQTGILNSANQ